MVHNRRGQITDRFTRAVEQLGNEKSIDVRLGGIYAMEQIACDSKKDHRTTMEVLIAFVQMHAPWPSTDDISKRKQDTDDPSDPDRVRPDADVMGALTVLGRRDTDYDNGLRLNLPRTDLRGARLRGDDAQLSGATLRYANLRGAHLQGAHLDGANLRKAILQGAHLSAYKRDEKSEPVPTILTGANLAGADLKGAKLECAILRNASLRKAILSPYVQADGTLKPTILKNADLSGADLSGADLRGAHIEGAHLDGAILREAKLDGAHADANTEWPEGLKTREQRKQRGVNEPPK